MNRFSLNSNIYNSNEIIKKTSDLGINLFRKFNNIYIFKTLIPGNNISITETDNFITINTNPSSNSNSKRFFINGITNERPIIKFKSITDIFLNVFGKTGVDQIYFNSNNDNYIGIHTHDINLSLFMHDGLDVLFSDPDIYFEMNFTVFSSSEIIIESNYLINYLN